MVRIMLVMVAIHECYRYQICVDVLCRIDPRIVGLGLGKIEKTIKQAGHFAHVPM